MFVFKIILVVFHISFAALIFGASLGLVGSCRRSLAHGKGAFRHAAAEAARRAKITGISGIMTFVTGLGLIFMVGGFGAITPNYHIAMTVMIGAIAVNLLMVKPAVKGVVVLSQAEAFDADAAGGAVKKIAMPLGILHLLWFSILALMYTAW